MRCAAIIRSVSGSSGAGTAAAKRQGAQCKIYVKVLNSAVPVIELPAAPRPTSRLRPSVFKENDHPGPPPDPPGVVGRVPGQRNIPKAPKALLSNAEYARLSISAFINAWSFWKIWSLTPGSRPRGDEWQDLDVLPQRGRPAGFVIHVRQA